jgi:hypothetical protein
MAAQPRLDRHGQLIIELGEGSIVLSVKQTADIAHLLEVRLNQELAAQKAIERLNRLGFWGRLFFLLFVRGVK